jgi:hypothetical protein
MLLHSLTAAASKLASPASSGKQQRTCDHHHCNHWQETSSIELNSCLHLVQMRTCAVGHHYHIRAPRQLASQNDFNHARRHTTSTNTLTLQVDVTEMRGTVHTVAQISTLTTAGKLVSPSAATKALGCCFLHWYQLHLQSQEQSTTQQIQHSWQTSVTVCCHQSLWLLVSALVPAAPSTQGLLP